MKQYFRLITIYLVCALMMPRYVYAAPEETTPYPVVSTSNTIENWPEGPELFSGSAVVMEAGTGTVLYEKNMDQKAYPASITKILTAILAIENCGMNEMVEFSYDAVFSVPRDSSHIAITPGEFLSVENCLYGLLLASANEVANALGEHVSGSTEAFVELMNKRAKELGAVNTHFNNTNGLPDENHYTTCYDMAMISRAAVVNETFIKIDSTTSYMIPSTNLQPERRPVNTQHPLLINGSRHYDGCFGGKTGYTEASGNTLVTFAKKNGMTLICVVMQSDSTHIYEESTMLLNYGFENFARMNIAEHETKFNLQGSGIYESSISVFESSYPQIELNREGVVVLPIGADFSEVEPTIAFKNKEERKNVPNILADIKYTWHGHFVGSTTLDITSSTQGAFSFAAEPEFIKAGYINGELETQDIGKKEYITINIWHMAAILLGISLLFAIWYIMSITKHQRERWKRIRHQRHIMQAKERRRKKRKYYPTRKLH